jgi:Tfp pilus assembly protein PilF
LAATGDDAAAWRVLKAGNNEADARTNLALAQEARGDTESALNSYRQAIQSNPDLESAQEAIDRLSAAPVESSPSQEP